MIAGSIARRYAKALLEIGIAQKSYDTLGRELEGVAALLHSSRELSLTLGNPIFALSRRRAVLDEVAQRLQLSPLLRNFLLLLLDRGRIDSLESIAREHRALIDQHAGRVRAHVIAARPIDPATESRLKAALERRSGKTVILEKQEDPTLLGGIVTQIGDVVYDGSIRTQLANMRQKLLSGAH